MILLIGPLSWTTQVRRLLTDRTSHSLIDVVTTSAQLRGVQKHIEVIACGGDNCSPPTHDQKEAMLLAKLINATLTPS